MLNVLSLGGGVQSTCLLLKCCDDEFQHPDIVIFSDTGSELPATYDTIKKCQALCEHHGIKFEIVKNWFGEESVIPGSTPLHEWYGKRGMLPMVGQPRCTFNWKINPIRRAAKKIIGSDWKPGKVTCTMWIGITTDERSRAEHKPDIQWAVNRYPLLEMNLSRDECISYLASKGWSTTVKSGCFCCPYQAPKSWAKLRRNFPKLFAIARRMEEKAKANGIKRGLWGTRSIAAFDSDMTLDDYGLLEENDQASCATSGGCFL